MGAPEAAPDSAKIWIAFYSHALNSAQRNYSATKRELLTIILAVREWRPYLAGRHFTLLTDHQALRHLHTRQQTSPMMEGWQDTLMGYDFTIVHTPGAQNVVPDSLSRLYPPFLLPNAPKEAVDHPADSAASLAAIRALRPFLDPDDWQLHPALFAFLQRAPGFGRCTVDLFASALNRQLGVWVAKPHGMRVSLRGHRPWINPPWALIDDLVYHLRDERVPATLITPFQPTAPWFGDLMRGSAAPPVLLPPTDRTFLAGSPANPGVVGPPPWGCSVAWSLAPLVEGQRSEVDWSAPMRAATVVGSEVRVRMVASPFVPLGAYAGSSSGATTPVAGPPPDLLVPRMFAPGSPEEAVATQLLRGKRAPPMAERARLLRESHLRGHFGADAIFNDLFRQGFYWSSMRADARRVASSCLDCQRWNIGREVFTPSTPIQAAAPMDHLVFDLFSGVPTSPDGFSFCLVVVDVATHYVWLRPLHAHEIGSGGSGRAGEFGVGFWGTAGVVFGQRDGVCERRLGGGVAPAGGG